MIRLIFWLIILMGMTAFPGSGQSFTLGGQEAIREYVEFADGTNRGMVDSDTRQGGLPDEDYDATTAMVINWHTSGENDSSVNGRSEFSKECPDTSAWIQRDGETFEFWPRGEMINRVLLHNLEPNSVYAFRVKEDGKTCRMRTMPGSRDDRPVKMVISSDHQSPGWNKYAHANAEMTALIQPDMFIVIGDFVNCAGKSTRKNADHWAL